MDDSPSPERSIQFNTKIVNSALKETDMYPFLLVRFFILHA